MAEAAVVEAFTALRWPCGPPAPPPTRARLLAAVAAPERRFSPFVARLARLLDLARASGSASCSSASPAPTCEHVPPNVELFHLEGGSATAGADVGFVSASPPGAQFLCTIFTSATSTCWCCRAASSRTMAPSSAPGAWQLPRRRPAASPTASPPCPTRTSSYAVVVFGVEFLGLPPRT